jgi:hypothetical protein
MQYESSVYTIVRIKRDMIEALASYPPQSPWTTRRETVLYMDGLPFINVCRESDSAHALVSTHVFHMDIDTTNRAKKRIYNKRSIKPKLFGSEVMEPCNTKMRAGNMHLSGVCEIVT